MSILRIAFPGPVDTGVLHDELEALNLPSLGVVSRRSRKTTAAGKVVLQNGKPVAVSPYVMIETDPLTPAQVTAAQEAVAAHVPPTAPKPAMDAEDIWRVLKAKVPPLVTDADVPPTRRVPK